MSCRALSSPVEQVASAVRGACSRSAAAAAAAAAVHYCSTALDSALLPFLKLLPGRRASHSSASSCFHSDGCRAAAATTANVLAVSTQKASGEPAALVDMVRRPPGRHRGQQLPSRQVRPRHVALGTVPLPGHRGQINSPRRKSRHPVTCVQNVHLALGASRRALP